MRPGAAILRGFVAAALCLPGAPAAAAVMKDEIRVEPGPTVMSPEEAAIAPDPNGGAEHGVVLVKESELVEDDPRLSRYTFHFRAKVLSNLGRSLGDLEIPAESKGVEIVRWWGRTILPDGSVFELKREDLTEHVLAHDRGRDSSVLKGALPHIEPGCVVDFGYVIEDRRLRRLVRVQRFPLQEIWPVRLARHRWVPWELLASGFVVSRAQGLDIESGRYLNIVSVVGRNLPAVVEEPLMPPGASVRASTSFFYFNKDENHADYWNDLAKKIDARVTAFVRDRAPFESAIATMGLEKDAPLPARLRALAGWVDSHVRIAAPEDPDALAWIRDEPDRKDRDAMKRVREMPGAAELLKRGEASEVQADLILIGLARAIGADAHLVLATDRTEHLWDRGVYSSFQFDDSLVALRVPGTSLEQTMLAAPGTHLPVGQVPWWNAGGKALEATAAGAHDLILWPSEAKLNRSEARVTLSFDEGLGSVRSVWSATGVGQNGLSARSKLRDEPMVDRAKHLDALCGSGDLYEVAKAASPGLDDPLRGFALECDATREASPAGDGSQVRIGFTGPWIDRLPLLMPGPRIHPVVFRFPADDRASIRIAAPPGYSASGEPPPVRIQSEFGAYGLIVTTSSEGFRVERSLAISRAVVEPASYAGLQKFLAAVAAADRTELTFARHGGAAP